MSTALITGAFTLGGVLVGGAVNITSQFASERRRARLDVRAAARLLIPELDVDRIRLRIALDAKRWPSYGFEITRWREHEEKLAAALNSEWKSVHHVYSWLIVLNEECERRAAEAEDWSGPGDHPLMLGEEWRPNFTHAFQQLNAALVTLGRLGDAPQAKWADDVPPLD